eukprot:256000-Prorocentrum_minimum.AAC.1
MSVTRVMRVMRVQGRPAAATAWFGAAGDAAVLVAAGRRREAVVAAQADTIPLVRPFRKAGNRIFGKEGSCLGVERSLVIVVGTGGPRAPIACVSREYTRSGHQSRASRENIPVVGTNRVCLERIRVPRVLDGLRGQGRDKGLPVVAKDVRPVGLPVFIQRSILRELRASRGLAGAASLRGGVDDAVVHPGAAQRGRRLVVLQGERCRGGERAVRSSRGGRGTRRIEPRGPRDASDRATGAAGRVGSSRGGRGT